MREPPPHPVEVDLPMSLWENTHCVESGLLTRVSSAVIACGHTGWSHPPKH